MAFLPDGRALVTTKGGWGGRGEGEVLLLDQQGAFVDTLLTLPVCADAERGLLGITLDLRFSDNGRVFIFYTEGTETCDIREFGQSSDEPVYDVLMMFVFDNDRLGPDGVEYLRIDANEAAHRGGGLGAMPDGSILLSTGEAGGGIASQDPDSPHGKLLRIHPDFPYQGFPDNPLYEPDDPTAIRSLVYASGLRNPFRFGIDQQTGTVLVTDVG
ncbi:MAG TPA: PQQ-dependent sugar dehydrogenase, partial [Ilumatobacteraceae bacterium]|nr:PQQ-dependent sugar dehydrogenase [Ilumatobacteraceae bacterium]